MSSGFLIQDTLEQELKLVRQFIALLEQETRALSETQDVEPLTKSTAAKNALADQLAVASEERNSCMRDLGLSTDKAGFDELLELYPELEELVEELFDAAAKASQLNSSNGELITTLQAHNKQAQDVIKALMAEETIYDERGRPMPTKGPAIDIKAS